MEHSIDQTQDLSHRELYSYLSGYRLPSYVKQAEMSVLTAPSDVFADAAGKHFPIDSKVNTFISNAFFTHKKASLIKHKGPGYVKQIEGAIKKAANVLGIAEDTQAYSKQAQEKIAADLDDLSVFVTIENTPVQLFAIKTAEHLQQNAENFVRSIDNYPFSWRRPIATQFKTAAQSLGVKTLPSLVEKYAGSYFPDIEVARQELLRRSTKLASADQQTYEKLAEDLVNIDSIEDMFKVAEICFDVESRAGLYKKAHTKQILGDPVDRLLTVSLEKAAEMIDVITMGGMKFAMADLRNVPSTIYEKAFGFELDAKTAEAREILPTMPKEDVGLFVELSGIRPI